MHRPTLRSGGWKEVDHGDGALAREGRVPPARRFLYLMERGTRRRGAVFSLACGGWLCHHTPVRWFLFLLAFCLLSPASRASASKPNIILVLTDDLGWGDLHLPGVDRGVPDDTPVLSTPTLSRLAQEGVLLAQHYSGAPVCAPARASLFSGVHQGHAQVVRNNNFDAPLEDTPTLADVLRAAGYATALIGKWGLGGGREGGGTPDTAPAWPTKRGFDFFFGYHNHIAGHRHYPLEEASDDPDTGCNAIWEGGSVITNQLKNCYSTDLFTARAKRWIADHHAAHPEQPFFLALTLTAPHARLALPAAPYPPGGGLHGGVQWLGKPGRMINTSEGTWDSFIEPECRDHPQWTARARACGGERAEAFLEAAQRHASMVARIDRAVGDLLQLCRDLGMEQRTFLVFLSDNGPHNESGAVRPLPGHPAPAQRPEFFRSYGPLDGIKRDVWEGGLRVPCIVHAPGRVQAGVTSARPSQFHDWMATFADLAGVPKPLRCDGVSLLPTLRGNDGEQKPGIVYTEYAFNGPMAAYPDYAPNKQNRRRGEQQALFYRAPDGLLLKAVRTDIRTGKEDFELYDVQADSHESTNLAPRYPELQEELRTAVLHHRRAWDYVRHPDAGERQSPCTGRRPYDGLPVPANDVASVRPGWRMRQVKGECPWTPEMETLPGAKEAPFSFVADPTHVELPAGSITEFRGYLRIPPGDGPWHFFLTLDAVPGSKAFMLMHQFHLIDAESGYTPGETADESSAAQAPEALPGSNGQRGIPLSPGLHEICLVIVQGPGAPGRFKLEWSRGESRDDSPRRVPPPSSYVCLP